MLVTLCALLLNQLYVGLAYEFGKTKQDSFFRHSLNFTELYYTCNNSKFYAAEVATSSLFLYGSHFLNLDFVFSLHSRDCFSRVLVSVGVLRCHIV